METPIVSVVMPVYNCGRHLGPAVESILAQTLAELELIAVDDGSTDGSLGVLRDAARRDARVRVVSRPNTGIVGALNDGLALARGRYVARMDGDDLAVSCRFAQQVDHLDRHADHVLVGSRVLLVDAEGAPIRPMHGIPLTHDEIDRGHLTNRWPMVHPTVLARREAIDRVGGYRADYQWIEDVDLFLRLAEIGRLANLADVLLHYRLHAASVCHTRTVQQARLKERLVAETLARRGIDPVSADKSAPMDAEDAEVGAARSSRCRQHQLWAWWALGAGNVATARKHAFKTLRLAPFATDSWRVAACALRGR